MKSSLSKKILTVKFGVLMLQILLVLIAAAYFLHQPKVIAFIAEKLNLEGDKAEQIRYVADVGYPALIAVFFFWLAFMTFGSGIFGILFAIVGVTAAIIAFQKLK